MFSANDEQVCDSISHKHRNKGADERQMRIIHSYTDSIHPLPTISVTESFHSQIFVLEPLR